MKGRIAVGPDSLTPPAVESNVHRVCRRVRCRQTTDVFFQTLTSSGDVAAAAAAGAFKLVRGGAEEG